MRGSGVVGCTIVAGNYLSYAKVVSDGWREQHPGVPFVVLVIDDDETRSSDRIDESFATPAELDLTAGELRELYGIYSVAELNCALKPHFLKMLLKRGADVVIYLDSDTDVMGDLKAVASLAAAHDVALSPHLLTPIPFDGRLPNEIGMSTLGFYNSGFIAVGRGATDFLQWWSERVRWDCLFIESAGLHADQRWLDWVPLYFNHAVIRDPSVNAAHWNLHERELAINGDGFTIEGERLRSFHFAGFDPTDPSRISQYPWLTRFRYSPDAPAIHALGQQYAKKLIDAGYLDSRSTPYRYARSASGLPLGRWERLVYREALLSGSLRNGASIPSPFDDRRSDEFAALLADPGSTARLSEAAILRVEQRRIIDSGGWDLRRLKLEVRYRIRRRRGLAPPHRDPDPVTSDLTRLEYASKPK
jgi:hypothetical protein